jgi:CCR4-NOT transcription complex subunit 4
VVINKSNLQTATKSPDTTRAPTVSAYITYAKPEDAGSCIQAIDGTWLDGKLLRASFGTTKYCSYFLRGVECANPDCMYLHDYAAEDDTYNKEDIVLKFFFFF